MLAVLLVLFFSYVMLFKSFVIELFADEIVVDDEFCDLFEDNPCGI